DEVRRRGGEGEGREAGVMRTEASRRRSDSPFSASCGRNLRATASCRASAGLQIVAALEKDALAVVAPLTSRDGQVGDDDASDPRHGATPDTDLQFGKEVRVTVFPRASDSDPANDKRSAWSCQSPE